MLPQSDPWIPKSRWALRPLGRSKDSSHEAYVIRQFALMTCKLSAIRFCFVVLFHPFPVA
jgi:hypothetical protein